MPATNESHHSKFHALLQDQIRNEFNAEHQYLATAVWFDKADLPQLAKRFYGQAAEERNHAMMIVQYFLDRDISIEMTGVDPSKSDFSSPREPIELALQQEHAVTDQIVRLASTAREEGDYLGERFMQWFLEEQVEEERTAQALVDLVASGINLFQPITFQHHKKKILSKILGVFGRVAAPANEREDRSPIQSAEFRERLLRLLIASAEIGRRKDKTPACRREIARAAAAFRGHTGVHRGG